MVLILFCAIIGFLVGLVFVMVKRKIRPGPLLAAVFLSLLSASVWKIFKDYKKNKKGFYGY